MNRVLVGLPYACVILVGLGLLTAGVAAPATPAQMVTRACPSILAAGPASPAPCYRHATEAEQMQWQRDHLAWVIEQQMKATATPSSTDNH